MHAALERRRPVRRRRTSSTTYFAPLLIGQDPTRSRRAARRTCSRPSPAITSPRPASRWRCGTSRAKRRGKPVYELLGGKVAATFVPTKWSVSGVAAGRGRRDRAVGDRAGLQEDEGQGRHRPGCRTSSASGRPRSGRPGRPPGRRRQRRLGRPGRRDPPPSSGSSSSPTSTSSSNPSPPGDIAGMAEVRRAVARLPVIADESVYSLARRPQPRRAHRRATSSRSTSARPAASGPRRPSPTSHKRRHRLHDRQQPRARRRLGRDDPPRARDRGVDRRIVTPATSSARCSTRTTSSASRCASSAARRARTTTGAGGGAGRGEGRALPSEGVTNSADCTS